MGDYLKQIEYAGLFSRIKRLSDEILYDTKEYYKSVNVDIEPNWHLIFLILEEHQSITLSEISEKLRMSHPACIKIINKMKSSGYIQSNRDKNDHRKQILQLTEKAINNLPIFHQHWDKALIAIKEIMNKCPHFFYELEIIENDLREKKYKNRINNDNKIRK